MGQQSSYHVSGNSKNHHKRLIEKGFERSARLLGGFGRREIPRAGGFTVPGGGLHPTGNPAARVEADAPEEALALFSGQEIDGGKLRTSVDRFNHLNGNSAAESA